MSKGNRIKLFADGADVSQMRELAKDPDIQGFTTNPTLMRKAGVSDYEEFARAVLAGVPGLPVSFEVVADDLDGMERQAREIASWGERTFVKIPVSNTQGVSTDGLVRTLNSSGVRVNVTAVFTLGQVEKMVAALAGGAPSVISVFAGRIADTGVDPVPHMKRAKALCVAGDPKIELLWASPREVLNIRQAEEAGCDIITATPDLLAKRKLSGKDLEQFSLETVEMFYSDATVAGYKI